MSFKLLWYTLLMRSFLTSIQIILALLVICLILLQAKGTGLGSTFGSNMAVYSTRRGVEKILFKLTLIISGLFLLISILNLLT